MPGEISEGIITVIHTLGISQLHESRIYIISREHGIQSTKLKCEVSLKQPSVTSEKNRPSDYM